ncbi:hypothetical protein D3C78_1576640 [compost metagenome]
MICPPQPSLVQGASGCKPPEDVEDPDEDEERGDDVVDRLLAPELRLLLPLDLSSSGDSNLEASALR